MDVPLLRKLSRKSILGFGKYADNSVQNLIDLRGHKYLRWVYFNCSKISFLDDIIKEIHIPEEFIINKPGTCSENHDKLNEILSRKIRGISKLKIESRRRKAARARLSKNEKYDRIMHGKRELQSKNHGK